MDRKGLLLSQLAEADFNIAQGALLLSRQEQRVAELVSKGHNATQARQLLLILRRVQEERIERRAEILKQLKE